MDADRLEVDQIVELFSTSYAGARLVMGYAAWVKVCKQQGWGVMAESDGVFTASSQSSPCISMYVPKNKAWFFSR